MPDLTDYLRASDGLGESVRLIVVEDRGVGDLVFNNTTPTNWHTYFIAMAGTVDPVTDRFIEGEYIVFKGHLDGSAITIDELAPGYVDNGNQEDDIIVIKPTTLWADIVADTMDTVTQAIIDAEAATLAANNAATAAGVATGLANTATSNANTATGNANTATTNANNAATAAQNAANATSWTQGTAVPTGGYDGNFYLRTTTYDVYQNISGVWTIVANIKGATGATGATGAAGANGSTWYNGSGAPSGGTGVNGDFYWDYTNYKVYTKAAGSWTLLSTISSSDANAIKIDGSATVTANIPFNAKKLTGIADPTTAQDAATKVYVDAVDKVLGRIVTTSGGSNYASTSYVQVTQYPSTNITVPASGKVEVISVITISNQTTSIPDNYCRVKIGSTYSREAKVTTSNQYQGSNMVISDTISGLTPGTNAVTIEYKNTTGTNVYIDVQGSIIIKSVN